VRSERGRLASLSHLFIPAFPPAPLIAPRPSPFLKDTPKPVTMAPQLSKKKKVR